MKKNQNELVIKVPDGLMTFEDSKTGVRTVAFPVIMGDGCHGALGITRLKDEKWNPSDTILEIIIKWR